MGSGSSSRKRTITVPVRKPGTESYHNPVIMDKRNVNSANVTGSTNNGSGRKPDDVGMKPKEEIKTDQKRKDKNTKTGKRKVMDGVDSKKVLGGDGNTRSSIGVHNQNKGVDGTIPKPEDKSKAPKSKSPTQKETSPNTHQAFTDKNELREELREATTTDIKEKEPKTAGKSDQGDGSGAKVRKTRPNNGQELNSGTMEYSETENSRKERKHSDTKPQTVTEAKGEDGKHNTATREENTRSKSTKLATKQKKSNNIIIIDGENTNEESVENQGSLMSKSKLTDNNSNEDSNKGTGRGNERHTGPTKNDKKDEDVTPESFPRKLTDTDVGGSNQTELNTCTAGSNQNKEHVNQDDSNMNDINVGSQGIISGQTDKKQSGNNSAVDPKMSVDSEMKSKEQTECSELNTNGGKAITEKCDGRKEAEKRIKHKETGFADKKGLKTKTKAESDIDMTGNNGSPPGSNDQSKSSESSEQTLVKALENTNAGGRQNDTATEEHNTDDFVCDTSDSTFQQDDEDKANKKTTPSKEITNAPDKIKTGSGEQQVGHKTEDGNDPPSTSEIKEKESMPHGNTSVESVEKETDTQNGPKATGTADDRASGRTETQKQDASMTGGKNGIDQKDGRVPSGIIIKEVDTNADDKLITEKRDDAASSDLITNRETSGDAGTTSTNKNKHPDELTELDRRNLLFYQNKLTSRPFPGSKIEEMFEWKGDYEQLERGHSYIQWLFPLPDGQGLNTSAQRLFDHEAKEIRETEELHNRVLKAYEMMLDFYGMELASVTSGEVRRCPSNWTERFEHLNRSRHNFMRLTRIISSLGHLGYERFQVPLVKFIMHEAIITKELPDLDNESSMFYWIDAILDEGERMEMYSHMFEMKTNPGKYKPKEEIKEIEIKEKKTQPIKPQVEHEQEQSEEGNPFKDPKSEETGSQPHSEPVSQNEAKDNQEAERNSNDAKVETGENENEHSAKKEGALNQVFDSDVSKQVHPEMQGESKNPSDAKSETIETTKPHSEPSFENSLSPIQNKQSDIPEKVNSNTTTVNKNYGATAPSKLRTTSKNAAINSLEKTNNTRDQ